MLMNVTISEPEERFLVQHFPALTLHLFPAPTARLQTRINPSSKLTPSHTAKSLGRTIYICELLQDFERVSIKNSNFIPRSLSNLRYVLSPLLVIKPQTNLSIDTIVTLSSFVKLDNFNSFCSHTDT